MFLVYFSDLTCGTVCCATVSQGRTGGKGDLPLVLVGEIQQRLLPLQKRPRPPHRVVRLHLGMDGANVPPPLRGGAGPDLRPLPRPGELEKLDVRKP